MRLSTRIVSMSILLAGLAFGQGVELDTDGALGTGPDTLAASSGEAVLIDAWVSHPANGPIFSANFTLSHDGPASWNPYSHATGWTTEPDLMFGPNEWLVQATDFEFVGLVPPFLHGTASYDYDGPSGFVTVTIVQPNGCFTSNFTDCIFQNNVGTVFGHPEETTPIEISNWGAVKELFR